MPVLIFLDPHARGYQAVDQYRELADEHGFILIGSRFSSNGKNPSLVIAHLAAIRAFAVRELDADFDRIALAGFSGGARIASAAMQQSEQFAAMIGCGAGLANAGQDVPVNYPWLGMIGCWDFNYSEMKQVSLQMEAGHAHSRLLEFNGKHEWPSREGMQKAFVWLRMLYVKQGHETDSTFAQEQWQLAIQEMDHWRQYTHKQAYLWKEMHYQLAVFDGVVDTAPYRKEELALIESQALKQHFQQLLEAMKGERSWYQAMGKAASQENSAWWDQKLQDISDILSMVKSPYKRDSWKRVKAYAGLVSFLQASNMLQAGQVLQAQEWVDRFSELEPDNPDAAYLKAQLALSKGDTERALQELQTAIDQGFDRKAMLMTDPSFRVLNSNPAYRKLLAQLI